MKLDDQLRAPAAFPQVSPVLIWQETGLQKPAATGVKTENSSPIQNWIIVQPVVYYDNDWATTVKVKFTL
jgi:hypothetical protein